MRTLSHCLLFCPNAHRWSFHGVYYVSVIFSLVGFTMHSRVSLNRKCPLTDGDRQRSEHRACARAQPPGPGSKLGKYRTLVALRHSAASNCNLSSASPTVTYSAHLVFDGLKNHFPGGFRRCTAAWPRLQLLQFREIQDAGRIASFSRIHLYLFSASREQLGGHGKIELSNINGSTKANIDCGQL